MTLKCSDTRWKLCLLTCCLHLSNHSSDFTPNISDFASHPPAETQWQRCPITGQLSLRAFMCCLHFPWRLTTSTSCPERMPRKGLRCKNNSLSYDKPETWSIRRVKKAQWGSRGTLSLALSSTQLLLPVQLLCQTFGPVSQISLHRSGLGCCWWLHPKFAADLIQVIQEVTLERD